MSSWIKVVFLVSTVGLACNGQFLNPNLGRRPLTYAPQQQFALGPAPAFVQQAPVALAPAPTLVQQAPVALAPAPTLVQQAPVALAPAPALVQQAPVALAPAPTLVQQAPVALAPAPATVTYARPPTIVQPVAPAPVAVATAPVAAAIAPEFDPHPRYTFRYEVNDPTTGDYHGQQESRDGDVVQGSYYLGEPDGSIRSVEYTADSVNGFNAVVHRNAQGHPPSAAAVPVAPQPLPQPPVIVTQAAGVRFRG